MAREGKEKKKIGEPVGHLPADLHRKGPSPKTDRFLLSLPCCLWNAIVRLLNSENLEETSPSVFCGFSSREHSHPKKLDSKDEKR